MANEVPDPLQSLTVREREVLGLLRGGLTNADIAEQLQISVDGAKYHVSEIIRKLGVRNRYEAAHWPGRPPWWMAAITKLAWGPLRVPAWASPVAIASATVLLVGAIAGLAFITLLLTRNGPAATTDSWTRSAALAPTPVFLQQPVKESGDGWSTETRVANLAELDLVLAVEELPDRVTLIDVQGGEAVAVGRFGPNVYARLKATLNS